MDADTPFDADSHSRAEAAEHARRVRDRWASLSPDQRREEFAWLERIWPWWRERTVDSKANEAILALVLGAAVALLSVIALAVWLIFF